MNIKFETSYFINFEKLKLLFFFTRPSITYCTWPFIFALFWSYQAITLIYVKRAYTVVADFRNPFGLKEEIESFSSFTSISLSTSTCSQLSKSSSSRRFEGRSSSERDIRRACGKRRYHMSLRGAVYSVVSDYCWMKKIPSYFNGLVHSI